MSDVALSRVAVEVACEYFNLRVAHSSGPHRAHMLTLLRLAERVLEQRPASVAETTKAADDNFRETAECEFEDGVRWAEARLIILPPDQPGGGRGGEGVKGEP
jgi:hypothetical protein